jgi:hypothetical protein
MWAGSEIYMRMVRVNTKMIRTVTAMKVFGLKIYNTDTGSKPIKMEMYLRVNLCMVVSLAKEHTDFRTKTFIPAIFTTVTVTASGSLPYRINNFTKENGDWGKYRAKDSIITRMAMSIADSFRTVLSLEGEFMSLQQATNIKEVGPVEKWMVKGSSGKVMIKFRVFGTMGKKLCDFSQINTFAFN